MVGDAAATDGCVFVRLRTAGVSAVDEWSLGEKEIQIKRRKAMHEAQQKLFLQRVHITHSFLFRRMIIG